MADFLLHICYNAKKISVFFSLKKQEWIALRYIMRSRFVHIIACFLFSLFISKEVAAEIRLIHAEKKEICTDCEPCNAEQNQGTEERSPEQEQKLPVDAMLIPVPVSTLLFHKTIYKAPYIPAIEPGIITPPPEVG